MKGEKWWEAPLEDGVPTQVNRSVQDLMEESKNAKIGFGLLALGLWLQMVGSSISLLSDPVGASWPR